MGLLHKATRLLIDTVILLAVIAFLPGIPPHGDFRVQVNVPGLPMEGPLAPNTILDGATRLYENRFSAPESVAYRGKENEIFVSMHGGSIVRIYGTEYRNVKEVAKIGPGCRGPWEERVCGRPLGIRFAKDGKLLVADAYLGIFKVDVDTGDTERLVDPSVSISGAPPMLIDDLDEDADGHIYWTDASAIADLSEGTMEILAGPTGRLLQLDPSTGQSLVLLDHLHFANGVQLSPDQTFVLVSESIRKRIVRYWLKGPKAGTHDVFCDGLPGYPDNIRAKPAGGYYASLVVVKEPGVFDLITVLDRLPWLRRLSVRILYATKKMFDAVTFLYDNQFTPQVSYMLLNTGTASSLIGSNRSIVVELDADGKVVSSLQGYDGTIVLISQTQQVGDRLFFASPYNNYLGMIPLWKVNGEPEPPKREPTIRIRPRNDPESAFHIGVGGDDDASVFVGDASRDKQPNKAGVDKEEL